MNAINNLDGTLNLENCTYHSYKNNDNNNKDNKNNNINNNNNNNNNQIKYTNIESNHPQSIIKQLPLSIASRLSSSSSSEETKKLSTTLLPHTKKANQDTNIHSSTKQI